MDTKPTWGVASIYGYALAFLSALAATIGQIQGDLTPLGGTPERLAWITASLVIVTTLGRYAQSRWGERPVSWGWGSTISYGVATLSGLLAVVADLADDALLVGVPQTVLVTITAVISNAVVLGRQLQATGEAPAPWMPPEPNAVGVSIPSPQ